MSDVSMSADFELLFQAYQYILRRRRVAMQNMRYHTDGNVDPGFSKNFFVKMGGHDHRIELVYQRWYVCWQASGFPYRVANMVLIRFDQPGPVFRHDMHYHGGIVANRIQTL